MAGSLISIQTCSIIGVACGSTVKYMRLLMRYKAAGVAYCRRLSEVELVGVAFRVASIADIVCVFRQMRNNAATRSLVPSARTVTREADICGKLWKAWYALSTDQHTTRAGLRIGERIWGHGVAE